jgi:hypothetical protein
VAQLFTAAHQLPNFDAVVAKYEAAQENGAAATPD